MGRLKSLLNLLVLALAALIVWHEYHQPPERAAPARPEPPRKPATPGPSWDEPRKGPARAGETAPAAASQGGDPVAEAIASIKNVAAQVASAAAEIARPEAEPAPPTESPATKPRPTARAETSPLAGDDTTRPAAAPAPDDSGDRAARAGAAAPAQPGTSDDPSLPANAIRGDGSDACPEQFPIKGNASSMIYHLPGKASYDRTVPELCFATIEAAEAAGFRAPRH